MKRSCLSVNPLFSVADANYLSTNTLRILVADKAEFCVWDKTILYQPSITIRVTNFRREDTTYYQHYI